MKPVFMVRYRGFLVRICDNGCKTHSYEWTVEPITSATVRLMKKLRSDWEAKQHQSRWMQKLQPRITDSSMIAYMRKSRLNNRRTRIYDPTSMPTARGSCGALSYGKDEVDGLLGWRVQPRKHWFRKAR